MKTRTLFFTTLLVLVLITLYLFFNSGVGVTPNANSDTESAKVIPVKNELPLSSMKESLNRKSENLCDNLFNRYHNLKNLREETTIRVLFLNRHLDFEGRSYRLREFNKEGENRDFKRYLVYLDHGDDEIEIIETGDHTPGKLYQKLGQLKESITYKEEGLILKSGELLQFENDQLISIKGGDEKIIDCLFKE